MRIVPRFEFFFWKSSMIFQSSHHEFMGFELYILDIIPSQIDCTNWNLLIFSRELKKSCLTSRKKFKTRNNSNRYENLTLAEAIPEDHILKRIGDKMSIIHFAARKGQFEIVKTLCKKVKNPIVPDYKGNSPIHYAAFNGHVEMLKFLTSYNANLDVQNLDGERPIQLAKLNDHSEAVKYLQECKARFQKQ